MRSHAAVLLGILVLTAAVSGSCAPPEPVGSFGDRGSAGSASSPRSPARIAGLRAGRAAAIADRQARAPASYDFQAPGPRAPGAVGLNSINGMAVETASGRIHVRGGVGAGMWATMLEWRGIGRGGAVSPVERADEEAEIDRNRLTLFHGDGLRQWYVNGELGIEQGFEVEQPPSGEPDGRPLVIEVALDGEVIPHVQAQGARVELALPDGRTVAWYDGLSAWDAEGTALPARMETEDRVIRVVVDDSEAAYPVVVDPMIWWQAQTLVEQGASHLGEHLGMSSSGEKLIASGYNSNHRAFVYGFDASTQQWGASSPLSVPNTIGVEASAVAVDDTVAIVGFALADRVGVYDLQNGTTDMLLAPWQPLPTHFGEAVATGNGWASLGGRCHQLGGPDARLSHYSLDNLNNPESTEHLGANLSPLVAMGGGTLVHDDALTGCATHTFSGGSWGGDAPVPACGLPLALGVYDDRVIAGYDGEARIFRRTSGLWTLDATLLPSAGQQMFGHSVAIRGSTAVVGAPGDESITIYMYSDITGLWTEWQVIHLGPGTHAAKSVAVGPHGIAVGAPHDDSAGSDAGAIHVFQPRNEDGDPCSSAGQCSSGHCVDGVCCDTACAGGSNDCQACSTAAGAPANGTCAPRLNATPCSDGDACTLTDTCWSGSCMGGNPVTCTASDACHEPGTCNPANGTCSNPNANNGTSCDDGNPCTQTDTCHSGVCVGGNPKSCPAQNQCQDAGICDPASGNCLLPNKVDGSVCTDGDLCTVGDHCQSGTCVAGADTTCPTPDQCHDVGECLPATGLCSNPAKTNGSACDDGNPATSNDACTNGFCGGSGQCNTTADCAAPANPCLSAQCVGGQCSTAAKPNNTACDDGNACSPASTCLVGTCTATSWITCQASDQCHDPGVCAPATGQCSSPQKAAGTPCNDGNPCTADDTCQAQGATFTCKPGAPVVCPAPDQCHQTGTCIQATGGCHYASKANGTACDDGDLCTQNDTCQSGVCQGGGGITCAALPCKTATCSPLNGCVYTQSPNGAACSDGNACTQTDTCQSGVCVGGDPKTCAAPDQCHDIGVCSPATGTCVNQQKPDDTPCNDGDACTQNDVCTAGTCTGGAPIACAALDPCHVAGTCDPATGVCSNPVKGNNDVLCDDGDGCTQTDICMNGTCTGTLPKSCPPAGQCKTNACNPASGNCETGNLPDGTPCNDGNACTQTDTCQSGACAGEDATVCPAPDACHDPGACNPLTGQCSNPAKSDGAACDDANPCTLGDSCTGGLCAAALTVACGALDQCHLPGACDPATGECSNPVKDGDAPCDDGDACTTGETCSAGICAGGTATVCPPSEEPCLADGVCDPQSGECIQPSIQNGTTCDDGDPCTQIDTCQSGVCTGQLPVVCDEPGQCEEEQGICDTVTGECVYTPKADGTPCDDDDACTQEDTCSAGRCAPGAALECAPPADACHGEGVCDPGTGVCEYPLDGTPCEGPATAWNGGGCACRQAVTGTPSSPPEWLAMLLLAGLARRTRRAVRR